MIKDISNKVQVSDGPQYLELSIIQKNQHYLSADAFLVKGCASKKLFEAILNRLKEDQ